MLGKIWKSSAGKVWMIVGAVLIVLALVVSILLSTVFYDVVGLVFGRRRPIYAEGIVSMYPALNSTSKEEAFAHSNALNIDVCEEGSCSLKTAPIPLRSRTTLYRSQEARAFPYSARTPSTSLTAAAVRAGSAA